MTLDDTEWETNGLPWASKGKEPIIARDLIYLESRSDGTPFMKITVEEARVALYFESNSTKKNKWQSKVCSARH